VRSGTQVLCKSVPSPCEFRSQESALFKKARTIAKSHVPYPFDKLSLASHSSARLQCPLAAMGCQGANDKPSRKIFASFAQATPKSWAGRDASGDWTPLPLVRRGVQSKSYCTPLNTKVVASRGKRLGHHSSGDGDGDGDGSTLVGWMSLCHASG
jgi:hypothetical protein